MLLQHGARWPALFDLRLFGAIPGINHHADHSHSELARRVEAIARLRKDKRYKQGRPSMREGGKYLKRRVRQCRIPGVTLCFFRAAETLAEAQRYGIHLSLLRERPVHNVG